jgi:uncharacterized membrane protein
MMNTYKAVANRLVRYFLAGAFAVLPLVVTIAIVIWVAGFLQRFVGPQTTVGAWVQRLGLQFSSSSTTLAYIVGWIVVLAVVFLLGVAVETGARRLLQALTDSILNRVPVVGSIYNTSKQLVSMLDRQDEADLKGMSVVYCIFGGDHGAGLLALLVSPQEYQVAGRSYKIVIIPTAPVPFGGALLLVPSDTIVPAEMSVDGLMSIYVSMGVTAPQFIKPGRVQQTPSDKLPGDVS